MPDARDLLERALAVTGGSLRSFAEVHMVRDERTLRRWRAGDSPIPDVAIRRLEQIVRGDLPVMGGRAPARGAGRAG